MAKRKTGTVRYVYMIPNKTGGVSTIPFTVLAKGYVFESAMKYIQDNNLQHLKGKLFVECNGSEI